MKNIVIIIFCFVVLIGYFLFNLEIKDNSKPVYKPEKVKVFNENEQDLHLLLFIELLRTKDTVKVVEQAIYLTNLYFYYQLYNQENYFEKKKDTIFINIDSLESNIKKRTGVCLDNSYFLMKILNNLQISNYIIGISFIKENEKHAINKVYINKKWYYVDPTNSFRMKNNEFKQQTKKLLFTLDELNEYYKEDNSLVIYHSSIKYKNNKLFITKK